MKDEQNAAEKKIRYRRKRKIKTWKLLLVIAALAAVIAIYMRLPA